MPLSRSGGKALGSLDPSQLVSSNQKEQDFAKFHEDLTKVAHERESLGAGGTAYHKGSWEVILGTYIYL